MRGHHWTEEATGPQPEEGGSLARWEAIAIDAVGNAIEFWGFKRNQGRVWAYLYLRGDALAAGVIEKDLGLSKGGVSMLLRDLERWEVVRRVRGPGQAAWRYRAETELVRMVTRVVEQREAQFIGRVGADLSEAQRLAKEQGGVSAQRLARLQRMKILADHTERALKMFLRTARLDVSGMFGILKDGVETLRKRGS